MTTAPASPTPSLLLRQIRRERNLTLEQMANALDTSKQRISQIENGSPVPFDRIRDWAENSRYEGWVQRMAYQLWVAYLQLETSSIQASINELKSRLPIVEPV